MQVPAAPGAGAAVEPALTPEAAAAAAAAAFAADDAAAGAIGTAGDGQQQVWEEEEGVVAAEVPQVYSQRLERAVPVRSKRARAWRVPGPAASVAVAPAPVGGHPRVAGHPIVLQRAHLPAVAAVGREFQG